MWKFRYLMILECVLLAVHSARAGSRELTFDQRVRAQEAIERVRYSHQIGATEPFESLVPRSVLESKVHLYLRQSAALDGWDRPLTAEDLRAELERMSA